MIQESHTKKKKNTIGGEKEEMRNSHSSNFKRLGISLCSPGWSKTQAIYEEGILILNLRHYIKFHDREVSGIWPQ